MDVENSLEFLYCHSGSVRGVAFSPVDRHIFCSGAYDGKVNLYNANDCVLLHSYQILATTTVRRLALLDAETGEQVFSYDNCTFSGRDRTALAVNQHGGPNLAVCTCIDGKGLALFDLRMPLPLDFVNQLYDENIRDVTFLHESWPWCKGQTSILSVAENGIAKVTSLDGRELHTIDALDSSLHSVVPTPEKYGSMVDDGYGSVVMFGGKQLSSYVPDVGIQETMTEHGNSPLWKIKYSSNGHSLFTACDRGIVRRYRRYTDRHVFEDELFRHKDDIEDMDISPFDEFIVTASKDRSVGVYRLGGPSHGYTEYKEVR
ncbi:uncharacterized protein LOC124434345 isoform X2 [Xenia sp. Carnegie-2017]|uniref:uncharacterized protein LOC124434345 isoform X2 n=1 Tax=Xenia sp. Carnegie-2017 TaxID=2897299 RepID=UPI001F0492DB|nr:uncharacterized protein LOC124434345 isoform X2 [Xenia sp. Carnegie-2017]